LKGLVLEGGTNLKAYFRIRGMLMHGVDYALKIKEILGYKSHTGSNEDTIVGSNLELVSHRGYQILYPRETDLLYTLAAQAVRRRCQGIPEFPLRPWQQTGHSPDAKSPLKADQCLLEECSLPPWLSVCMLKMVSQSSAVRPLKKTRINFLAKLAIG
jgi:hypothetical protein